MIFIGFIALIGIGLVLGSIGAGGSMLAIPVLVYLFAMDMETASAYSLFLVGATSLTGAMMKQKERGICLRTALTFGLPSITAAFITRKWIVVSLPKIWLSTDNIVITKHHILLTIFCLMMSASAILLLRRERNTTVCNVAPRRLHLIGFGLATGLCAGLVGAGGGFMIIPALILFAGLPFSIAAGTSLLIIAFNSLLGFCGDVLNRPINWWFLSLATALAISGLVLGSLWRGRISARISPQRTFAWFTLIVVAAMLTRLVFVGS